jgi:GrpB-like predicted nucleotidyltransferase (UPF0157 family)
VTRANEPRREVLVDQRVHDAPVTLAAYDPAWPIVFARAAERIRAALGDRVVTLEHIGSTAVPGMAAKPVVDMVLAVPDPTAEAAYVPPLSAIGYVLHAREPEYHEHRLLKPADRATKLHVFGAGCPEVDRLVRFRDRLRSSPADFELYLATKRTLAARTWRSTHEYADAKGAVVAEILARATEAGP